MAAAPPTRTPHPPGVNVVTDLVTGTVLIDGELDLSTGGIVRDAIGRAARMHPAVTVDLSRVAFTDVAGLRSVLAGADRVVVRNPSEPVTRLTELIGVALPS